ncbi:hypothetical protein H1C71_014525, partial [Ictidomys tridecemlineatus]
ARSPHLRGRRGSKTLHLPRSPFLSPSPSGGDCPGRFRHCLCQVEVAALWIVGTVHILPESRGPAPSLWVAAKLKSWDTWLSEHPKQTPLCCFPGQRPLSCPDDLPFHPLEHCSRWARNCPEGDRSHV